jgi:spore germination cell wall hydrolase CwlJ-like protein
LIKFKNSKSIFLTSVLIIGILVITSQNIFASILTTKIYTVKSGDCLSSIARNHGESLNNLRKVNNIWNDLIFPKQILNVSVTTSSTVQQPTQSTYSETASATVQQHTYGVIHYTSSDVDLLARLITAEARGESYNAQVAVGAVVVNRVESNSYPKSISAVINEVVSGYYQFTPVQNGSINKPAQANEVKAAYAALSGNDPTNKSLFYYDDTTTDTWIKDLPVSIKIDNLIFAY